jgi:phospholipid/cholesterol/gamma-HCH transport system substrate-binding protein
MPRTRSQAWSELKIGIISITAIAIAVVTIFLLTGGSGFFWQRYSLKSRFTNVAGLNPGSPVRLAGLDIGSVSEIQLVGEQVDVVFEVNEKFRPQITSASVARLGSVSLLGESAVDITPSGEGTPIDEWGYVPTGKTPAALADITDQASQGITELTALIHDLREGKGTAGKLMTDEQLYRELNRFVSSASDLTQGIRDGKGTLGKLVTDPKTADTLNATLGNIEQLTRSLNAGEGSLGKLLKDDAFSRSLTSATSNLDTLMTKINSGEGTMGKLMTDQAVYNQLNSLTQKLDSLVTQLNAGEGTAGQLLKDKRLYENINTAVNDMRTLIANINKDPRKYLNIKVSLF